MNLDCTVWCTNDNDTYGKVQWLL